MDIIREIYLRQTIRMGPQCWGQLGRDFRRNTSPHHNYPRLTANIYLDRRSADGVTSEHGAVMGIRGLSSSWLFRKGCALWATSPGGGYSMGIEVVRGKIVMGRWLHIFILDRNMGV